MALNLDIDIMWIHSNILILAYYKAKIHQLFIQNPLNSLRMNLYILILLIPLAVCAPPNDRVDPIPVHFTQRQGYPRDYPLNIYSGYLDLNTSARSTHYVFVESVNKTNDPVTLWLNGGPGCSSLLGFIQEIGPYYLPDGVDYKVGDELKKNNHSWHLVSNLLFFESPTGVGFSYNNDTKFVHSDASTAQDNMAALVDFFKKYPEYTKNQFWIAGESYAGKYIPDLSVLIDKYNENKVGTPINFKGILVGNGIMSFRHLEVNRIEYLIKRNFIDPELVHVYQSSCKLDPDSAGCRYATIRMIEDTDELNPYNVFGYCYYNDSFEAKPQINKKDSISQSQTPPHRHVSQESILMSISKQIYKFNASNQKLFTPQTSEYNAAPCSYFDGMYNYFNLHRVDYHAMNKDMKWNGPCADIQYSVDPAGSMQAYRYLLGVLSSGRKYSITLYSGDWDAVVPYSDTIQGILSLNLQESYKYQTWITDDQHSGFKQLYSGILFVSVKGASHQVPQSKRTAALDLFNLTLQGSKNIMATE